MKYPQATVQQADARQLPLSDRSVDIVITSPPYLNAIDYMRGHKLSLVWMGYTIEQLREIRSKSVGSEHAVNTHGLVIPVNFPNTDIISPPGRYDSKTHRILLQYVQDMRKVTSEIARVLVDAGTAILVVADSNVRGVRVPTARIIRKLAEDAGLELVATKSRAIPDARRYLPPPSLSSSGHDLQKRMRKEKVMIFHKS
ncbi:MAG: hypothetical protein M1469_09295 [Bacteroidetes bacterium]|nr:hypothetical protein [Bacteroidota bacterium]MCL5268282.1 hypothetical protein [Bacteroidota bacterium]